MFKTIIAVVAFLVLALIFQLYEQERLHVEIARQQQEALKAESDKEAKAAEEERARQLHSGKLPQLVPAADDLATGTFSVSTGVPKEFRITVDAARMFDVTVTGQFAVSGKSSGVEVFIFDEDDYTNWMYGNDSVALFASGRKTMGELHTRIEKPGRYFLIFHNSTSSTSLEIHANIQLQYKKPATPT
jgi:hypothetical protein